MWSCFVHWMRPGDPLTFAKKANLHEHAHILSVQAWRRETPAHAGRVMGIGQQLRPGDSGGISAIDSTGQVRWVIIQRVYWMRYRRYGRD
jgi:hypothetical protein